MVHFWSSGTMPHIYETNSNQWTAPFSQASRPSYQHYSQCKSPISGLTSPTHTGLRRREKWSPYLQDQLIGHALEFWIIWGLKLPGAFYLFLFSQSILPAKLALSLIRSHAY